MSGDPAAQSPASTEPGEAGAGSGGATGSLRERVLRFPSAAAGRIPRHVLVGVALLLVGANVPLAALDEIVLQLCGRSCAQRGMLHYALPFKGLTFAVGLALTATPLVRELLRPVRAAFAGGGARRRLWEAAIVCAGLAILILPLRPPDYLAPFAQTYGVMTQLPLGAPPGVHARRLLVPVLAHLLFFRGYFLYAIFSLLTTFVLVVLAIAFVDRHTAAIELPRPTRLLLHLSLATTSFVAFHFISPGYPENLVFVLFLAAALVPLSPAARLSVVALTLVAHEGSTLCLLPVVLVCFPRGERLPVLALLAAFGLLAVAGSRFDADALLRAQLTVGGRTALQHLLAHPGAAVAGTLLAHKLFWLAWAGACALLLRRGEARAAGALFAMAAFPLLMLPIATDTSRIVGFGAFGVLYAVVILVAALPARGRAAWVTGFAALNLLVPTMYAATNAPRVTVPGLYRVLAGLIYGV